MTAPAPQLAGEHPLAPLVRALARATAEQLKGAATMTDHDALFELAEIALADRPLVDRLDAEYQALSAEVANLAASGKLTPAIETALQERERRIVLDLDAIMTGLRPRVRTSKPRPWHRGLDRRASAD